MKRFSGIRTAVVPWVAIAGLTVVLALGPAGSQPVRAGARAHPRLLFTAADIGTLQAKVRDGQGYDDAEYTRTIATANGLLGLSGASLIGAYQGIYNITQLGMVYRLALDGDANKVNYQSKCQQAMAYVASTYGPEAANAHNSSLRLIALSLGFDLCYDDLPDGDPTPSGRQAIIDEILTYLNPDPNYQTSGTWFDWWNRATPPYTSNKGIILGSSMGLGSIVLRGETGDTATLDSALSWGHTMVLNNIAAEFDTDGSAKEGELYGPFATRYLIPYVEARQRYDGVDLSTRDEIRNYGNWLAYTVLPTSGGIATQSNNGNYSEFPVAWNDTYQNWAQTKYNSQLARWVWEHTSGQHDYTYQRDRMAMLLWNQGPATVNPQELLPDSMLFRGRGFYFYRSGWPALGQTTSDDTLFTFFAGSFGGGHLQEDQAAFSLFSKQYWFSRDSAGSQAAKESEAHNLVFIDNAGLHNAGSSIGIDGSIPAWNLNPFADYLQADTKNAYATHSPLNDPDYPWPGTDWSWGYWGANPVLKADRHLLTMKASAEAPEYFVVFDDIDKNGSTHTYDWTFHTEVGATLSTTANPVVITGAPSSRKLKLYFANPTFATLAFSSANYPLSAADPDLLRLKATVTGVVNPQFMVAVQPLIDGTTLEPVRSVPSGVTGALAAQFAWATVTDDVYARTGATISHGTLSSDAAVLAVRRDASGALTKFQLGQGTSLTDNGQTYVTVTGGTASVASDGITVSVSDPALQYVIDGPNVTAVVSNHQPIAFQKVGGLVYVNALPPAPLTISGLQAFAASGQQATVSWTTSASAVGQVAYGTTVSYGSVSSTTPAGTQHLIALSGLSLGTLYHYRVHAIAGGSETYSSDQTFTVTVDSTPPAAVSDLRVPS